ncbi:Transcription factor TFIIIB component B [Xylographa bjoerkii]|nr:Transcription factor TFIIIB component B [Xylographa bjoerkii]
MASAVSSYLSKSKKDFKPKAPARRPAAAGSHQSTVHGSAERQADSHSQTRQIPAAPLVVPTVTSEFIKNTSTSSNNRQEPNGSVTLRQSDGSVAVTIPLGSTPNVAPGPSTITEHANNALITQNTETTNKGDLNVDGAVAISLPRTRLSVQRSNQAENPTSTNETTNNELVAEVSITEPTPPRFATGDITVSIRESQEPIGQPAAKRRKINTPEKLTSTVQRQNVLPESTHPVQANEGEQSPTGTPGSADTGNGADPAKPQKKNQTAKAMGKRRMEDVVVAIVADATRGDGESGDRGRKRQKRETGPRQRAQTPEDAESIQIEPGVTTMADLCKDNRTGKKSKRETALQAREAEEVLARKQHAQQTNVEADDLTPTITQQPTENLDTDMGAGGSDRSRLRALVPSVRIVNGQLVHDESSRTIDRVALANESRGDDEAVVVVDSLSHKVNSGTYMKRERKSKWNEAMTDQFYDGLRMFGTDFSMICKMFPGKSRKTVKLKFSKEEKFYPERIKSTLLGERIPVDMEEFSKLSNTVYKDPKELESDMAEDRKRLEEEQAKEKATMEEAVRERAEEAAAEAAAESAGGGEDSSAKENNALNGDKGAGRKMGGKRAKKNGRPPIKRPPVNKAQAHREARAEARVVARVLRPAPLT